MTTEAERLAGYLERFTAKVRPSHNGTLSQVAALLRQQAAEIERLKSEAELFAKHTGLTFAAKDTLLRQALGAMQWEVGGEPLPTLMMESIAAIKQHLGDV